MNLVIKLQLKTELLTSIIIIANGWIHFYLYLIN